MEGDSELNILLEALHRRCAKASFVAYLRSGPVFIYWFLMATKIRVWGHTDEMC